MYKSIATIFTLLLTNAHFVAGQSTDFYGSQINNNICDQFGFVDSERAATIISTICGAAGIPNNFVLMPCQNIDNCIAVYRNQNHYILYDVNFLNDLRSYGFSKKPIPGQNAVPDWPAITILAHEIAHHVLKHTTHSNNLDLSRKQLEIQADEYAGTILCKLGASLEQAQQVMFNNKVSINETLEYPSRQRRLDAIRLGYSSCEAIEPPPQVYSVSQVLHGIELHVSKNNSDRLERRRERTQISYKYYISGPTAYLNEIKEVRYVRNHYTFEELDNPYKSSGDRNTNFSFSGYQWGYINDAYVTIILKSGKISQTVLKRIRYDN